MKTKYLIPEQSFSIFSISVRKDHFVRVCVHDIYVSVTWYILTNKFLHKDILIEKYNDINKCFCKDCVRHLESKNLSNYCQFDIQIQNAFHFFTKMSNYFWCKRESTPCELPDCIPDY